ncbi:MAG: hypothetical protein LBP75_00355 [Planctomycetota bacterium]|jgi:hypothetical protein|nr:hypothetical protein [Planctomycetota bacterium]
MGKSASAREANLLPLNPTISDVRTLFNKDNHKWLNWIEGNTRNDLLYADIKKLQVLVAQQRTNFAEVDYLNLKALDNLIERHRAVKDYYSPSALKTTTQQSKGGEMATSKVAMVSLLNGNPQMKLSDLQALRAQGQEKKFAPELAAIKAENALRNPVIAVAKNDKGEYVAGLDAENKNGQKFTQCAGATAKEAVSKLLNDANATGEAKREGVELDKLDAVGAGVLDRKQSVEGVMSGYDIDDKLRGLYSRAKNFLGEGERNPGMGGAKRARRDGRCRQKLTAQSPDFNFD